MSLDAFGTGIELEGTRALVSAYLRPDPDGSSGVISVFDRDGSGVWNETFQITAEDADAADFGLHMQMQGDRMVAGARLTKLATGQFAGATYPFDLVAGGFEAYGSGCPGSNGCVPSLQGSGCPSPEQKIEIEIANALPNSMGFLFLGTGQGSAPLTPTCNLQILPFLPTPIGLFLPGLPMVPCDGSLSIPWIVPAGTQPRTFYIQVLIADSGASGGVASTNPLCMMIE